MTSPSSIDRSPSCSDLSAIQPAGPRSPDLFVFLELFAQEGGIQSYSQDLLKSYLKLADVPPAAVFLLRDRPQSLSAASAADSSMSGLAGDRCARDRLQFRGFGGGLGARSIGLSRLALAGALLWHILQRRPQRVICGHVYLAPLVALLCRGFGIPYTVITHGKEVWQPLTGARRWALRQADEIWTVSRYSRDRATAANQLDPEKIRLMPCAVDGDRFAPAAPPAELIDRYGLAGSRVLLTVARLWSGDIYKGVDVTIRALPQIAQAIPNVKYLVIGRGDDQPRLAALATELGVADRVVFAGFVSTADLVNHYRLADLYVMPSQEGFGIVYLEAMACGLPVIAGDADGAADPLQDGRLGWQVPHRDVAAVAAACITVCQQLAARDRAEPFDPRCDGDWLRQQTIARFGQAAFAQRVIDQLGRCP